MESVATADAVGRSAVPPPAVPAPPAVAVSAAFGDEVPWRVWDWVGIEAVLFVAWSAYWTVAPGLIGDLAAEGWSLALYAAVYVTLACVWVRCRQRGATVRLLGPRPVTANALGVGVLWGIGVAVPYVALVDYGIFAVVWDVAGHAIPEVQPWTDVLFHPLLGPLGAIDVIILGPIAEEVVFRGLLLRAIARRRRFWVAAVVSSALFGLAHYEPTLAGTAYMFAFTFPAGLVFAWLLRRTGTIVAPITAHIVMNAAATIGMYYFQ